MKSLVKRLWQEDKGQDLVEYGLLLVLVSLGAVAAMGSLARRSAVPLETPQVI